MASRLEDSEGKRARGLKIAGLSFALAFTGAVTPGPLLALVIAQVLAQGLAAVVPILLGHALLEAFFLVLLFAGMGRVLAAPRVRGACALVGGGVLAWMAWMMLRDAPGMTLASAAGSGQSAPALLLAGIGVSLANPYFTGWWATVGTGQLAAFKVRRWREIIPFFIGHELGDAVWYVFVALLLVGGRGWLTDPLYRGLIIACGLAVGGLALLFLVLGARTLRSRAQP